MSSPSDTNERPSKKARPTETSKENTDNDSNETKKKICRFRITDLEYNNKYGKDCYISLVSENQGLYHLIDAVFHHQLHELSGGDSIYSHLWKVKFNGFAYDSDLLLPEFGSVVCNAENPRLLSTFNPKKGQKGSFRGKSGEFKFVLEDVTMEASDVQYPKYQVIEGPIITASVDSSYISTEEKQQAMIRRNEYHEFYNNENDWKMDRHCLDYDCNEVWVRAKPVSPEWGHKEDTVIGLFLKGGWKFKKSWTHGLQYALLHRAESATSGRWYQLRKEKSYFIQDAGRGMSQEEMIIQAKKLCKSMMEATLAKDPPGPLPKPKSYKEITQDLRQTHDPQAYEQAMFQRATHRNHETFDF